MDRLLFQGGVAPESHLFHHSRIARPWPYILCQGHVHRRGLSQDVGELSQAHRGHKGNDGRRTHNMIHFFQGENATPIAATDRGTTAVLQAAVCNSSMDVGVM